METPLIVRVNELDRRRHRKRSIPAEMLSLTPSFSHSLLWHPIYSFIGWGSTKCHLLPPTVDGLLPGWWKRKPVHGIFTDSGRLAFKVSNKCLPKPSLHKALLLGEEGSAERGDIVRVLGWAMASFLAESQRGQPLQVGDGLISTPPSPSPQRTLEDVSSVCVSAES